ncbi:MAG TPA: hypothetical protein ENI79_01035 [Rhodospirillales bacterium]|nr:hypothetical protein [Rhodospirillales bacterium]
MKRCRRSNILIVFLAVIIVSQFLLGTNLMTGQAALQGADSTYENADSLGDQDSRILTVAFATAFPPTNASYYRYSLKAVSHAWSLSVHEIHATGPPSLRS